MAEIEIPIRAKGTTAVASLPELELHPRLASAKYLRITVSGPPVREGVFEVDAVPRRGARTEIYLRPGQLGLEYDDCVKALASPVTHWTYRRSQLKTPTGYLVLGTLAATWSAAWIDGSLAIGNMGIKLFEFSAATLGALGVASLFCKLCSALLAFLLALWFKK